MFPDLLCSKNTTHSSQFVVVNFSLAQANLTQMIHGYVIGTRINHKEKNALFPVKQSWPIWVNTSSLSTKSYYNSNKTKHEKAGACLIGYIACCLEIDTIMGSDVGLLPIPIF